jgi:hypothetical protein
MDVKHCFKILEIKETESLDEIKQAYRDLISIWHPDRYVKNPRLQEKATEKVKELNSAYNYLISHATQIRMSIGGEKKTANDHLQPIVVICPKCQTMNRFQANMWVKQRKCIYCNFPLLNEGAAFHQSKGESEKRTRDNSDAGSKKRGGFRWIFIFAVIGIGLFYLGAPRLKIPFLSRTEDVSEERHAAQPIDVSLGKERIVEIQRFLRRLAYDPGPPDGELRNETRNAIKHFNADFSVRSKGTDYYVLLNALERHTAIAKLHPEWPAIFKSKDFEKWIDVQEISSPEMCKQVIAAGSVLQVASLLDLYKFDRIDPDPVPLPPSGILRKKYTKGFAPLTIQTRPEGRHYYVKLISEEDDSEAFSAFLRSGFTLTEHVPVGKYRLKYAVGTTWYGLKWLFGSKTVYNTLDQAFDFRFQGNEIKGYRLNLYLVPAGSSRGQKPYDFNF